MSDIRIQAAVSNTGKKVVARLLPGTDLLAGIREICLQTGVSSGVIVSVLGSLKQAEIVYAVPDKAGKIGIKYHDPVRINGPLELLACQGIVGKSGDGELSIHLHGLMSDPEMRVFGGHFLENVNPVLATAEILIQETADVEMIREQDEETGFPLFKFYGKTGGE